MSAKERMTAMLRSHGPQFTGQGASDAADLWLVCEFTADQARPWCEIGVWDPETAAALRDALLTPEDVLRGVESLPDAVLKGAEALAEELQVGAPAGAPPVDPIDAACRGDLAVGLLVEAARKSRAFLR